MRLSQFQINVIKEALKLLDPEADVCLFGSRTDDSLRGGDIDLLIDSRNMDWRDVARLREILNEKLGEQKIDLVLKNSADSVFVQMIEPTSIQL
jgi:uncharacterized protein